MPSRPPCGANRGGTSVSLYGNPPESFLLDGYVPSMTLAAGQEVPVLVHFRPDAVGPIHNTVEIRWDKHLLSFHLLAKVIPDPNAKTTVMDAPLNQSANRLARTCSRRSRGGEFKGGGPISPSSSDDGKLIGT